VALKRPSARPSEGPLTEMLPTRNARGEFVSAGPETDSYGLGFGRWIVK
jgi:hypothetical protein